MPEGVDFPFPSLLFHEGRTYGQPQVATGLRLRLPGSFRRRAFHADLLMPQEALFARGAHLREQRAKRTCLHVHLATAATTSKFVCWFMQAVMHRALLRRGRSGRYHFLLRGVLPAGNQCRIRQKGGNGSWQSSIIR